MSSNESVRIVVVSGQNRTSYTASKNLLSHYSPFLARAIHGNTSGPIQITHQAGIVSHFFIQWLYTQFVFSHISSPSGLQVHRPIKDVVWLWLLAEFLEIPRLQNQAVQVFFTVGQSWISSDWSWIKLVYKNTRPESSLRTACAAICCFNKPTTGDFDRSPECFAPEFLVDLKGLREESFEEWETQHILEHLKVAE